MPEVTVLLRTGKVLLLLCITLLTVECRHTDKRFIPRITDSQGSKERLKRSGCETLIYYDVRCHDLCPRYNTNDWVKNDAYLKCKDETTYHCAKDAVTGKYIDACGKPVLCNRGTGPKLSLPEGHEKFAHIICEICSKEGYNPEEFKKSDTFSRCPRRRKCKNYEGEIECEEVTGIERSWTDSKCRCDITRNFIPTQHTANICTAHYSLACYEFPPCKHAPDGRKQQYLSSNYTCSPVCGEGFHPRSLDSDECVLAERQDQGASERYVTDANISEVHSAPISTPTPINSSPDDQKTETSVSTQRPDAETTDGIWILGVIVAVVFTICVFILLCYRICCRDKNKQKSNGTHSLAASVPLLQQPVVTSTHSLAASVPLLQQPVVTSKSTNCGTHSLAASVPLLQQPVVTSKSTNCGTHSLAASVPLLQQPVVTSTHSLAASVPLLQQPVVTGTPSLAASVLLVQQPVVTDSRAWISNIHEDIKCAELTEIDITYLAPCLGNNWELVASKMKLTEVEINHIKLDHQTTATRIWHALNKWKNNNSQSHTLGEFLDILTKSTSTTIDWEKIQTYCEGMELPNSHL